MHAREGGGDSLSLQIEHKVGCSIGSHQIFGSLVSEHVYRLFMKSNLSQQFRAAESFSSLQYFSRIFLFEPGLP